MSSYDEIRTIRPNEKTRRALFKSAMEGKWEGVMRLCSRHPWLCGERITRPGNTALHLAVYEGKDRLVRQLVGIIESWFPVDEAVKVLGTTNTEGNTPLHLAVLGGNFEMCRCICDGRPNLLGVRNNEGETPLFLAVHIGEMDVFACLLRDTQAREYVKVRNRKGDTILHCAISEQHWKLAFLILKRFPDLHDVVNEKGQVPLHVLAEMPGAFRSGTYLSLFDSMIYELILPWFTDSTTNLNGADRDEVAQNNISHISDASDILPPCMLDMLEKGYDKVSQDPCGVDGRSWSLKGQNYIQKIKKKKERNMLSIRIMQSLLTLQSDEPFDFNKAGWNRRIALATNPYAEESEIKKETDSDSGLPDISQSRTNEGAPENDDKGKKTSEEGSNLAVMFKVDKDEPHPDGVLVRVVGGDPAVSVAQASADAEKLDKELRRNKGQEKDGVGSGQTPILLAAKNGITEMVKAIIENNPIAINEVDMGMKNAVLLAVENRQPRVCQVLLEKYSRESSLFRAVDQDGCSALHLAAKFSDNQRQFIPGAALQMQCEVLWFEYVKNFLMPKYFPSRNFFNETADEMFTDHHKELMEKGKEWLNSTSNSCSLVATIIATVAFATSITVPGGARNDSGKPYLEHHLPFRIFAVSSLVALCFSVTSIVMFLAILTSRHLETDFGKYLPRKLLLGLTTLFISILAMLVNFCSSHFFVLQDELKMAALPVYAVTCLPATYFAVAQLPLYIDLLWATFSEVPRRWMKKDV